MGLFGGGEVAKPFGSNLLTLEQGEAASTGQALLDLATDFYSPIDPVRKDMGVALRGVGERLAGLDEQVLRPLAERLAKLGEAGRTPAEMKGTAEQVRRLAHDLLELGDRLGALATQGYELGPGLRPLVQRAETLSRRMNELGTRVGGVSDRLLAMRPEELSFLSSLATSKRAGGAPGWGSSGPAAATPNR